MSRVRFSSALELLNLDLFSLGMLTNVPDQALRQVCSLTSVRVVSLVLLDTIGRSRNCLTVAKQIKGPLDLNLAKNLRKGTAGFNFLAKSMVTEF